MSGRVSYGRGRGRDSSRGRSHRDGGHGRAPGRRGGRHEDRGGRPSSISILYAATNSGAAPLSSEAQMCKLVQSALHVSEVEITLQRLGSHETSGLLRLQEIAGHAENFSCQAAPGPGQVRFLLVVVPLLRLITQTDFTSSLLTQLVNPVYAVFAECEPFLEGLARCMAELQAFSPAQLPGLGQTHVSADSIWQPSNWLELLAPVAIFLGQAVIKFRKRAASKNLQQAVAETSRAFKSWSHSSQVSAALPQRLLRDVDRYLKTAQSFTHPSAKAIEREEETARRAGVKGLLSDLFHRERRRGPQPKMLDGPGTLSLTGEARHDNDPVDFRQVAISPTMAEVMSRAAPYLPGNRPDALHHLPSDAVDRLLDTHFRLLRHDLMNPLFENMQSMEREAVLAAEKGAKRHRHLAHMPAFHDAVAVDLAVTHHGASFVLEFDQPASIQGNHAALREFWERTRRLGNGMLVCLRIPSSADQPLLVFATISKRDSRMLTHTTARARISVELQSTASFQHLLAGLISYHHAIATTPSNAVAAAISGQQVQTATLLEAADSYFAYAPVLKALQQSSEAALPFSQLLKYNATAKIGAPAYLIEAKTLNLSSLCKNAEAAELLREVTWLPEVPAHVLQSMQEHASLDADQAEALAAAVTKELTLIQGPPGTGKTFIGIKIVLAVLANTAASMARRPPANAAGNAGRTAHVQQHPAASASGRPDVGPVLVICFTNHALDQFLEGLIRAGVTEGLVRIGGGSKSEIVQQYNLKDLAQSRTPDRERRKMVAIERQAMEELTSGIEDIKHELCRSSLIPFRILQPVIEAMHPEVHAVLSWHEEFEGQWQTQGRRDSLQDWLQPRKQAGSFQRIEKILKRPEQLVSCSTGSNANAAQINPFEILTEWDNETEESGGQDAAARPGDAENGHTDPDSRPAALAAEDEDNGSMHTDVWSMPMEGRWQLYNIWAAQHHQGMKDQLMALLQSHAQHVTNLKNVYQENDRDILRTARVVGVTTTGAAMHQSLLAGMGSRMAIVEEAGEVLEAHILASLSASCEQLVLIGDHHQLRPKTQVYDAREQMGLDVSLFERLIRQGNLAVHTMLVQRRMRPSISELIRMTIYPGLIDGDSVKAYPPVSGLKHNVFFLDHHHREEQEARTLSHVNKWEAKMTAALALHMARQGCYGSEDIAVITPYLGQLLLLRQELQRHTLVRLEEADAAQLADLADKSAAADDVTATADQSAAPAPSPAADGASSTKGNPLAAEAAATVQRSSLQSCVRLATVDNFQGEEAKIIIISLVRSNKEGRAGFLNTSNRINVLLSRAMHGMVLIGNADTFAAAKKTPMWQLVLDKLRSRGEVGTALPLQCNQHPDDIIEVREPRDFAVFAGDGGCHRQCIYRLPCGHTCRRRCHADDKHHKISACHEPCPRLLQPCKHICTALCGETPCPPCPQMVDKQLPCGHTQSMRCSAARSATQQQCMHMVEVKMPVCGHTVKVRCSQAAKTKADPTACGLACKEPLSCGHECSASCGACMQVTLTAAKLGKSANAVAAIPALPKQHAKCKQSCRALLVCRHPCNKPCHSRNEPCSDCSKKCWIKCPHASCSKPCSQVCTPCVERCTVPGCPLPCGAPCAVLPAVQRCDRLLKCKHQCPSIMGQTCPSKAFCAICASDNVKSQVVDMLEFTSYGDLDLDAQPVLVLDCGHIFTVETLDGHMGLTDVYKLDAEGCFAGLKALPEHSEIPKSCPNCSAPISGVARYGRIIKKAMNDLMDRKFAHQNRMELTRVQASVEQLAKDPERSAKQGKLSLQELMPVKARVQNFILQCQRSPSSKVFEAACALWAYNSGQTSMQQCHVPPHVMPPVHLPDASVLVDARRIMASVHMLIMTNAALDLQRNINTKPVQTRHSPTQAGQAYLDQQERRMRQEAARKLAGTGLLLLKVVQAATWELQQAQLLAQERSMWLKHASVLAERAHVHLSLVRSLYPLRPSQHAQCIGMSSEQLKDFQLQHLQSAEGLVGSLTNLLQGDRIHAGDDHQKLTASAQELLAEHKKLYQACTEAISLDEKRMVYAAIGMGGSGYIGHGHWYECSRCGCPYVVGECGAPQQHSRCPACGQGIGGVTHNPTDPVARAFVQEVRGSVPAGYDNRRFNAHEL